MKTSELTGHALDWAVAKCEPEPRSVLDLLDLDIYNGFNPSTNWAKGGPIIERETIALAYDFAFDRWQGYMQGADIATYGPTPLIAAMRCYVASKLGDDVEIPKELT